MKYKAKPDRTLATKATTEWSTLIKRRGFKIYNLILGNVNASGFTKAPNMMAAICQPFALLSTDDLEASSVDPKDIQPHLIGSGLGSLTTFMNISTDEVFQERAWDMLCAKLNLYKDFGIQALYSPSSMPVDSIDGNGFGLGTKFPFSIGAFLGMCRRQLNLRDPLNIRTDWTVQVSSYSLPVWEVHSVKVTPPMEAFEDMVLPAIGEYLALMATVPSVMTGTAEQIDEGIYQTVMASSVLANLKSFDRLVSRLQEAGDVFPDMTEFRTRMDFAERFVDEVAKEIVAKVNEPGDMEALNLWESDLIRSYVDKVDQYGSSLPYTPFNKGQVAYGLKRHQADVWKANPDFLSNRTERLPTKKRYRHYFKVIDNCGFDRVASYAFQRTYPESYVTEVAARLSWHEWSPNKGRAADLNHGVWESLREDFKVLGY